MKIENDTKTTEFWCSKKDNKTKQKKTFSFKGQLQREHKLLSYERALKMLKNDICINVIGQAVLEIFHFNRISLEVSIKSGEQ